MLSIIDYLESRKIPYKTEGHNVTKGWVEIPCLFCFDPSQHLGINLTSGFYSCWSCGTKGFITKIIKEIDGCSYKEANKIAKSLLLSIEEKEKQISHVDLIELPKVAKKEIPIEYRQYLEKRRYNAKELFEKYNLYSSDIISDWRFRLIIPIYMNHQLLTFTGRDITGLAKIKYKHNPTEKSILSIKDCLYGIDHVKRSKGVIVEGVFDMWRIGNGAIATFGTQFTHSQIYTLSEKELKQIIVLYDNEEKAVKQAKKLANILSLFIEKVEVWELSEGDPDTMNETDLREVKKWLLL